MHALGVEKEGFQSLLLEKFMSRLIELIERVGSSASFANLSAGRYEAEVLDWGFRAEESNALLKRDVHALTHLVGGQRNMICMIALPEEDSDDSGDVVETAISCAH
jgi:hypothetical protein